MTPEEQLLDEAQRLHARLCRRWAATFKTMDFDTRRRLARLVLRARWRYERRRAPVAALAMRERYFPAR